MCFFNKLLGRKQGRAGVPENPAGAVLGGNYKVLNVLGTGTFSSVYLVQSLGCGRQYAVKQTSISELSRAEHQAAMDELRLLASLSHPNLIQFHGGFVEGESLCVVVDLLPSGDLGGVIRQHLAFGRHIPEEQVWTYLLQLAAGLRHLHSHSVIHRDIKPANCLLDGGGLLKIADLGVAGVLTGACVRLQMGTPGYMAPELFRKDCQSFPADIFSLGCLLYVLCTLRPLFAGAASEADVERRALAWTAGDALTAAAALLPHYSSELRGLL